ncbi:hypothetical protein BKP57_14395 [Virgibacillus sp. 6R]|uniref:Uncharacterized protein n=1 Tax=Virgibacillus pantothenticus TaxID=1473 RepID=A0A0L0QJY4_VIRPA|nr:hypothetical protein BKP57_14395 [Virgibacillus sp. 6R]KNE18871.1 hypothetical protein AFK71_09790 [Virgibacillus pantothenticus]
MIDLVWHWLGLARYSIGLGTSMPNLAWALARSGSWVLELTYHLLNREHFMRRLAKPLPEQQ